MVGAVLSLVLLVSAVPVISPPSGEVRLREVPVQTEPVTPPVDWGDDVLVGSTGRVLTTGKLITDSDTTGDIYVAVLEPGGTALDTVHVWRSLNGGYTWELAYQVVPSESSGPFLDYELRVGHDANGTWLYDFIICDTSGSAGGLWVLRHRPAMEDPTWVRISGGDSLLRLAADRNIESAEHLFVAWETQGGDIHLASSRDTAQTWGNHRVAASGCERPAVCAGGDGCVYVACNSRDSSWIQFNRYTNNLVSPDSAFARLDSGAADLEWSVSVAADREAPCSSQTAMVLFCSRFENGNVSVRQGWTQDGGAAWQTQIWLPINQQRSTWDARSPHVRRSYDDQLFRGVTVMPESWDTLVYSFARPTSPMVWEERGAHADFSAVPALGAVAGYSSVNRGGYVAYVARNSRTVWFDGYLLVGVEQEYDGRLRPPFVNVRPSRAGATIRFFLETRAEVRVRLYGVSGRLVGETFQGEMEPGGQSLPLEFGVLPSGAYFCVVDIGGRTQCAKVLKVK